MLLEKGASAGDGLENPLDEQAQPVPIGQRGTRPEVLTERQELLEGEEEALGDGELVEGKTGRGHVEIGKIFGWPAGQALNRTRCGLGALSRGKPGPRTRPKSTSLRSTQRAHAPFQPPIPRGILDTVRKYNKGTGFL